MTLGFYCVKLLLPLNLCYYSNLVIPYPGMETIDGLLIVAGVVCAAFMLIFWRRGIVGMMLVWIGITLLPVLNIITLPVSSPRKTISICLRSVFVCLQPCCSAK